MKNPNSFLRWALAVLLLGVVTIGHSQANPVNPTRSIPDRPVVTVGRSFSMFAEGATGSVQWQVSNGASQPWADVIDNVRYHGAATDTLEISGAPAAMDGLFFRFTDTGGGSVVTSNVARLTVSPLLFPSPSGMALDANGSLVVSDSSTHTLRRINNALLYGWGNNVACSVAVLAGTGGQAGTADGTGAGALFNQPGGLALSADGTILVADTANATIRRINGDSVTTLAGSSSVRGNQDGSGLAATFSSPMGVAKNPDGSFYVADTANHTIRKVAADGTVSTFAGSAGNAGWVDGTGQAARFNNPTGIAVDVEGTLYVSDTTNNLIRKITRAGAVTTLAGVAGVAGAQDGPGDQATFNGPTGVVVTGYSSNLYVADTGNSTIRQITSDGTVKTYAGVPAVSGLRDGTGYFYFNTLFNQPKALAYEKGGVLFIADTGNAVIRAISQYDGVAMTLPLSEGPPALPSPPASVIIPASPAPAPSSNGSGSSSGNSSGGGSIGGWFFAALGSGWLLRKLTAGGQAARAAGGGMVGV